MADFSKIKEAGQNETMVIQRGMVLLAGMAGGAGLVYGLLQWLSNAEPSTLAGIAGPFSLGLKNAAEQLLALGMVVGGLVGAILGQLGWIFLGQIQKMISPLDSQTVLKRAAAPFIVFFPQITFLCQGKAALINPIISFLGLVFGLLLLALLEKKDKRKIYFAHPTENEYTPLGFFAHGCMILLGAGAGWFWQSLPLAGTAARGGLWFALNVGIVFWIVSLLLAALMNLFFSKQTFDQNYIALCLAMMPLALLPLQAAGWIDFIKDGQVVAHHGVQWLPVVLPALSGVGIAVILAFSILKLRRQPVETGPAWEELFRALMLILGIPFLLYAVAFNPQGAAFHHQSMAGSFDLFRDGESLGVAQAILAGKLPFKEILLRHGFLADAASGLAALQWIGPSAASWRTLMVVLAPLGLISVYLLAIFCLPWVWAVGLAILLLTGHLGSIPMTRFLFPIVSFIFTLYFIQRGRWLILLFSGLTTVLALIASHTAGVMALVGNLIMMVGFAFFGQGILKNRLIQIAIYFGAVLGCLLPWWLYLGMTGSLGAYFENFSWVISRYGAVYGLSMSGWAQESGLGRLILFLLPPVILVIGGLMLLQAVRQVKQNGYFPWNVLILCVLVGALWLRFLSRSTPGFLYDVIPLTAMLAAFFLYRLTARQHLLRGMVFAVFLPFLFVPLPGFVTLPELIGSFGMKNSVAVDGYRTVAHERLEELYVPDNQAKALDEIMTYLDGQVGTTESFYDFSNQPLLYFLVPRTPVVKTLVTSTAATFDQQLDTIRHLANADLKSVVFQGDMQSPMVMDGIPSVVRQYAISEYLLQMFSPAAVIAQWVLFSPPIQGIDANADAIRALKQPVDIGLLPLRWGAEGKYDPGQGGTVTRLIAKKDAGSVEADGVTVTAQNGKISVAESNQTIRLQLVQEGESTKKTNVLVMELKSAPALDHKQAVLSWGEDKQQSITFTISGDGLTHRYVFRLGAFPTWVFADSQKAFRLSMPGGGWTWEQAVFLQVKDIPELEARRADAAKTNVP